MARLTRWMQKVLGRATNPLTLVTRAKAPTPANRTGKDENKQSMVRPGSPTPRAVHERRWPSGPREVLECNGGGDILVFLLGSLGIGRRSLINKLLYDDMHGGELYEMAMLVMEDEIPRYICGKYIYPLDLCRATDDSVLYYAKGHDFFSVILAYDVYSQASFDEISLLYDTVSVHQNSGQPKINILILGLKSDLLDSDAAGVRVTRETGEAFASARGCSFAECSAKSGDGVYEAFGSIVEHAYDITAQFSGDAEGRKSFINENRALMNRVMQAVRTR